MSHLPISRRTVLKGLGVSMALPFLDAMIPKMALGQSAAAVAFPRRMAVIYVPHGVVTKNWAVAGTGTSYSFSKSLQPLVPFRDDILVLSGLTCDAARPHGDGSGGHARAQASFLTGKHAKKSTSDIQTGVSMDQLCAQRLGNRTRLPSLEMGTEAGRQAGGCDPGYSCAYTSNLCWRDASTPAPKETNPRAVFDRMFANANAAETASRQQRMRYEQSILDFVLEDARALSNNVGQRDRRRMDEYLTSIRDLERRLAAFPAATRPANVERPPHIRLQTEFGPAGGFAGEGNVEYSFHLRALCDVLALAFQTDSTRIATHVFSNEISNRSYRFLGVSEGHHDISHHQNDPLKMDKCFRINRFHVEEFAYLVRRLKSIPEGEGTLLDNCMLLYGSGIGDGAFHNHDELPIVLAGKGGGTIDTGRHLRYARNTPVCNLFLEMLDRMGLELPEFGDSSGRLRNLS